MNTYAIFYNGREDTISAPSLYAAKVEAIIRFRVPRSRRGLVSVMLIRATDRDVPVSTQFIGE